VHCIPLTRYRIIGLWTENFELQSYQTFLAYLAFVFGASLLNTFGIRLLPHIDRFGGVWGMIGVVVISITLLACSSGKYQSAKLVFAEFTNLTGVRT